MARSASSCAASLSRRRIDSVRTRSSARRRVRRDRLEEDGARDAECLHRLLGGDARGARQVVEQRHLADEIAGLAHRDDALLVGRERDAHRNAAGEESEELVARFALDQERGAGVDSSRSSLSATRRSRFPSGSSRSTGMRRRASWREGASMERMISE